MRPINLVFGVIFFGLVQATADDKACLGCHSMIQALLSNDSSHPAMALGCVVCHTDHTQASSANRAGHYLIAAPADLCAGCHAGIATKEFVHEPVKKDCTLCHNPHAGLKAGMRAESNALCLECHSDSAKSKFETEGPVKLFGGQITVPPRYFPNLPFLALQNDRGHPVSNHPVLRNADADWPAVNCIVCHKPHGADKSAALLVPETENYFESLCQRCHK
jgi:predicted CXXCH cytochrome family protein